MCSALSDVVAAGGRLVRLLGGRMCVVRMGAGIGGAGTVGAEECERAVEHEAKQRQQR